MAITKTVVGITYEETKILEKELNISIYTDMGTIGLDSNDDRSWKAIALKMINVINKKHNTNIPHDAKLFCSDGDQDFDFYIGFMF